MPNLKIRRALVTVSDKRGVVELGRALVAAGAEIIATGKTATVLKDAEIPVTPIEKISGSPEAFAGRMKTLSFSVCGGILYRRGDAADEKDLQTLKIAPIDCVVVNFYPFEQAAAKQGVTREDLIDEIDVGGPTLVRAAAKNAPDVLVLTDPGQYPGIIEELSSGNGIAEATTQACAARAWETVLGYDYAIACELGEEKIERRRRTLRYGENPHQTAYLEYEPSSPIAWGESLTPSELSYNNILDLSAAYQLASELHELEPDSSTAVIVKHNNPCGAASVQKKGSAAGAAQLEALKRAWEGDPVSAFGGVVVLSDPLEEQAAVWLMDRFIEVVASPGLFKGHPALQQMLVKRRNLKAAAIRRLGEIPREVAVTVPGGKLVQTSDRGTNETLSSMTRRPFPQEKARLAKFGIAVCRSLKSNAVALVRETSGGCQLIGAGQGQPNRVDALKWLAVPRAQAVIAQAGGSIGDCVLVSDAFFPFRDTVDEANASGIRFIVQPGGSIKDSESVHACDEHGISMAFTGIRHFRH